MSEIEYHPNFNAYVEMIVAHPNYQGLYYERKKDGTVGWVVAGKSAKGQLRQAWWDETCKKLGIPLKKGCYAKAAKIIHPTGIHICQCCGAERSIFYEYPTKRTLKKINEEFGLALNQTDYTIREFVKKFCTTKELLDRLSDLLGTPYESTQEDLISYIKSELIDKESPLFSPGVMCNPPDRFNGFHSYALCCRKEKDTGRHDDNMKTYTQDRRAYEEWSDGDYNLANRMMGEFHKQPKMPCPKCGKIASMSADHIGPISLGFCHSRHFAPMCQSCNSAKNNRFTKSDVDQLLELEHRGEQVVSWHSKYIWDLLKNNISNDIEAKLASAMMAKCHQNVLNILAIIHKETGGNFLMRYLHPEYSLIDYRFEGLDLTHLERVVILANPLNSKNKSKNQNRYIRIAFESLEDFLSKDNRKNSFLIQEDSEELKPIFAAIKAKNYDRADRRLKELIEHISSHIYYVGSGIKEYQFVENTNYPDKAAEP